MANETSEQEFLAQAIAGDSVATQQLLLLHHDGIVAILEKKVPPDLRGVLAAEDVCQEAYIAAVRELPAFQPLMEKSFFNWVLTIAERKLIDAIRTLRAAKRGGEWQAVGLPAGYDVSSMAVLLEQVAIHSRTPSHSAASHEIASAVHNALSLLREDYRTALHCRHIEGLSVAETAKRMKRSEGAVRMLCIRGVQRLAELLGDPSRFFSKKA